MKTENKNAFQVYDAAFDAAQGEYAEDTVEYIKQYADAAMNIMLSNKQAQAILDCRLAWIDASKEEGGIGSTDTFWHLVEEPLREIKIE